MPSKTDKELLDSFVATGDGAAFAELVSRYTPMVYRACRRLLGNDHDAEDATQAAFVVLSRKAGSLRQEGRLNGWLHRVARLVALEALRRRSGRERQQEQAALWQEGLAEELSEAEREAVFSHVDAELDGLSAILREAIVLRYLRGFSEQAAAAAAGCPLGTMKRRASEGLAKLRARLAKRGVALSGVALASLLTSEASAAIPETLLPSILVTVKTAVATTAAATTATSTAAMLAKGAMKAMFIAQVKMVAAVGAAAMVLAGGAGMVTYVAVAGQQEKPAAVVTPPVVAPVPAAETPRQEPVTSGTDTNLAQQIAQSWVRALLAGRVDQVMAISDVPFSLDGKELISTAGNLRRTIKSIVKTNGVQNLEVFSLGSPTALDPFKNLATNGLYGTQICVFPAKAGEVVVVTNESGASVTLPAGLTEWVELYRVAIKPGHEPKVIGVGILKRADVVRMRDRIRSMINPPQTAQRTPVTNGDTNSVAINGNRCTYDATALYATYEGDVQVTATQFTLTADRVLTFFENTNQLSRIEAFGHVVFRQAELQVTCDKAVYEKAEAKVTMPGKAVMSRTTAVTRGKASSSIVSDLVLKLNDNHVTASGGLKVQVHP